MILYHVVNIYHLVDFIVHRLARRPEEKAILMFPDTMIKKFPQYGELTEFFTEVWEYTLRVDLHAKSTPDASIRYAWDRYFAQKGVKVTDFSEIYLGGAQFYFGMYLVMTETPHIYHEETCGLLSRPQVLRDVDRNVERDNPIRCELAEKYGGYDGSSPYVQKYMCSVRTQLPGYENPRMEDFDMTVVFRTLTPQWQAKILDFFRTPRGLTAPENSVLMLTQNFANLFILSFFDQILIYQLVIDYFFRDKTIVFKTHPFDFLYYETLFPQSQVIRERFPAELLPLVFENMPKVVATVSSTAINSLEPYFDDSFRLEVAFETTFRLLPRYDVAVCLAQALGVPSLSLIAAEQAVVENLCKRSLGRAEPFPILPPGEGALTLVGDIARADPPLPRAQVPAMLDAMGEDRAVLFLDCGLDFPFFGPQRRDLWENIIPIRLRKRRVPSPEFCADEADETFYLYTKNKEWQRMANEMSYEKTLHNTGLELQKATPDELERRVMILEGILEATEKRLQYYITRNKELEAEAGAAQGGRKNPASGKG